MNALIRASQPVLQSSSSLNSYSWEKLGRGLSHTFKWAFMLFAEQVIKDRGKKPSQSLHTAVAPI